jgi:hypothetical protein
VVLIPLTAQPEPFGRSLIYRIEANFPPSHGAVSGMLVDVGWSLIAGRVEHIFRSRRIPPSVTVAPPQGWY